MIPKRAWPFEMFEFNEDNDIYTVSQKNDNDVAHYNFNTHKPILVIFCTDVAE